MPEDEPDRSAPASSRSSSPWGEAPPAAPEARIGAGARIGLVLLATALLSALTLILCAWLWRAIGGAPMTVHGWIALGIAVSGTALLTTGLMALAFHSHRSGHDERVKDARDVHEGIRRLRGPRR